MAAGENLSELYPRSPANLESCHAAAKEQLACPRDWPGLAEALKASGERFGVPEAALAKLEELKKGKVVAVVTGQQAGYLGGPLFTFLKAYHATRLAARLEADLGLPVLPVFWIEGEDHDFEEVRRAGFLTSDGGLESVSLSSEQWSEGRQVGLCDVNGSDDLAQMRDALRQTDEKIFEFLLRAYEKTTLSEGMGRLLSSVLGPRGLIPIEGGEPPLKRMALPLWERIIKVGESLSAVLAERSGWLEENGWKVLLKPTTGACLFYLLDEQQRRVPVFYDGTVRGFDGKSERLSSSELLDRITQKPELLSPKAALRPLYQDFVLPTIAYVAGPGETDYHAQLAPFYSMLDVTAPALYPRLSVTIMDAQQESAARKTGFSVEELMSGSIDQLSKTILERADEGITAARFEACRTEIEKIFGNLEKELAAVDPTLEGAVRSAAGKALHPLSRLQQKAEKALKQKHSVELQRLEKALAFLKPGGLPAERALSTAYCLLKYGPEKLLSALDQLPEESEGHCVITIQYKEENGSE